MRPQWRCLIEETSEQACLWSRCSDLPLPAYELPDLGYLRLSVYLKDLPFEKIRRTLSPGTETQSCRRSWVQTSTYNSCPIENFQKATLLLAKMSNNIISWAARARHRGISKTMGLLSSACIKMMKPWSNRYSAPVCMGSIFLTS